MRNKNLIPIGKMAKLFHISVSTLRHYEKSGLVYPEETDPWSGYRYYSTSQFETLNTIRYLRALDTPLDEIKAFLSNRQLDKIQSLLQKQRAEVMQRQQELTLIQKKIDRRISQLEYALEQPLDEITVQQLPRQRLAVLPRYLQPDTMGELELYLRELEKDETGTAVFLGKVGVGISESALKDGLISSYHLVFLIIDEEDMYNGPIVELDAAQYLVVNFKGSHESAPKQYRKLLSWINTHDASISGFSQEITLIDAGLTNDKEKYVTELRIPFIYK